MYLTQSLHNALQQDPDRPLTHHQGRVRTVAESADRIARLAGAFQKLRVPSGGRVGMLGLNGDRYHEYLLAVPWADAALAPLNYRWSVPELAHAITEAEISVLLVDEPLCGAAQQLREQCADLHTLIYCGSGTCPLGMLDYEQLITQTTPVPDARRGGQDLFGLFYTGGTTGTPKGVMLSHDNVHISALGTLASGDWISSGGRMLHVAPLFHMAEIFIWLTGQLQNTTHLFLPAFTPNEVLHTLQSEHITDVLLVPTMLQMMVDHPEAGRYDLSGVLHVLYGTSPISQALLERVRQLFPNAKFSQAYGMTELAPVATVLRPADHDQPELRASAGRAAPHAEVRVVDEHGTEVDRGTVGEIVARGDHMMVGYWKRPQESEQALRGGWMHTGDVGYMDELGYVWVVDRLKDMIVTGGENVYSAEVEAALAHHPGVASCAVIGVPDQIWGEKVHAVVVPHPGHEPSTEELRQHCLDHIAPYKAPRSTELVAELPLASTGKILKRELRKAYGPEETRPIR